MDAKYTLSVPVGDITEIDLRLSSLKGEDIIAAQAEFEAVTGSTTLGMLELSKSYQAFIVSKAAKIPYETVIGLPVQDFNVLTLHAQNFLLSGVSLVKT
jgi:hypothetical protein